MAYIVAAVRTAGGKRAGKLSGWHPTELGAEVLNSLINKTKIDPSKVRLIENKIAEFINRKIK